MNDLVVGNITQLTDSIDISIDSEDVKRALDVMAVNQSENMGDMFDAFLLNAYRDIDELAIYKKFFDVISCISSDENLSSLEDYALSTYAFWEFTKDELKKLDSKNSQ